MLIRGFYSAKPCFNSVTNTCQRTVMKKMRNISPVTDGNLLKSIVNRCLVISWIFQLNNTKRKSINIKENIWTAIFLFVVIYVFYSELIYNLKNIFVCIVKIDKLYCARNSITTSKLESINKMIISFV